MDPKPWSFSSLEKFVGCPKQYHEITVLRRVKDEEGAAAGYGNFVHEHGENYLKARGAYVLPPNPENMNGFPALSKYREYFDSILRLPGRMLVENKYALNRDLQPVDFFAPDVWVRGKADVTVIDGDVARGLDHKTGKRKPGSRQMVLMALLIFYHHPEVRTVKTAFFWMKTNEIDTGEYTHADIPAMWNMFVTDLAQYRDAFHGDVWQPRKNGLCHGWCPVHDCEFWQPKRVRTR